MNTERTCTTCRHKRIASSLEVLSLCTAVMTGMTKEERAAYDPKAPCTFWQEEKQKPTGITLASRGAGGMLF